MPLDLGQLTRRLSSSYHPSEAQPYSLEASFQTVLDEERRIYEICERMGILLEEDALPLLQNTFPRQEEREMQKKSQDRSRLLPTLISIEVILAGYRGAVFYQDQLHEIGRVNESLPGGLTIIGIAGLLVIGYHWLRWNTQQRENKIVSSETI